MGIQMTELPELERLQMKIRTYMICGLRPVFSAYTDDGGLAVYAYQWETGMFALDMGYLSRTEGWPGGSDDDVVDSTTFEATIARLRAERRSSNRS